MVWTDGSAMGNKAGGGVFYGDGNPRNVAIPVSGKQTSQRAELTAVLYILENEERKVQVRTDSMYVRSGVMEYRKKWRRRAWYGKPTMAKRLPHADLWFKVDRAVERKRTQIATVQWVKGHASVQDTATGRTTELNAWGNAAADSLAGHAAQQTLRLQESRPHHWGR